MQVTGRRWKTWHVLLGPDGKNLSRRWLQRRDYHMGRGQKENHRPALMGHLLQNAWHLALTARHVSLPKFADDSRVVGLNHQ